MVFREEGAASRARSESRARNINTALSGVEGENAAAQTNRDAWTDRLPVAGDDADAEAAVLRLVERLGFDDVDAGSLAESWRQQPGTPVYGTDFDTDGVRRALSEASKVRAPEWRPRSDQFAGHSRPAAAPFKERRRSVRSA